MIRNRRGPKDGADETQTPQADIRAVQPTLPNASANWPAGLSLRTVLAHPVRVMSATVRIEVIASRDRGASEVKVTEGLFTFVAIDDQARPRLIQQSA